MTEYFIKTRELGEMILASEQANALAEANLTGENINKAKYDYDELVNQVINILKATVYKDLEENESHCGGCCKGK